MRNLKHLVLPGLAVAFVFGLGSTQAKEWEQSFTVNLRIYTDDLKTYEESKWGFSKDSLVEGYSDETYSHWTVNRFCVCDVMFGDCNNVLSHYQFSEFDQHFWKVVSKDGLKNGTALDLTDTALFKQADHTDGTSLYDSYVFESKDNAQPDTNYFVYQKDSTYYALCQYITVYDSNARSDEVPRGVPAYYIHQCIYQNDGTPTFSKIPMYSGKLPESRLIYSPRTIIQPLHRNVKDDVVNKSYLINGRSAKGKSAMGVRVEKARVYRPSVSR